MSFWYLQFSQKTNEKVRHYYYGKVEKILKGSLGSIAGRCQQTFKSKKFVGITQQCFALLAQVNFPVHNLNFH